MFLYVRHQYALPLILMLSIFVAHTANATTLATVKSADQQGLKASQLAQQQHQQLDQQQQELQQQNHQIVLQTQLADHYQQQLNHQIQQLQDAIIQLQHQRQTLRETRMQLLPLMQNMLTSLQQLIDADLPFLQAERQARLDALTQTLASAELDNGEKMTRLLDAYQVEVSYGYSNESWQGKLPDGSLVTFLRAGRLGYYYLSLDQQSAAIWQQDRWQPLDTQWLAPLAQAIAVTTSQIPPALMQLPLIKEVE